MDGLASGIPEFEARSFVTVDARQNAFIDYQQTSDYLSGTTGAMPAMTMMSAQVPNDFQYVGNVIGIGGTPSPIANGVALPLVTQAPWAETFLRNMSGSNESLY